MSNNFCLKQTKKASLSEADIQMAVQQIGFEKPIPCKVPISRQCL